MTFRDATPDDIPALAELVTQLGYPTPPEEMAARFAAITGHPDHKAVLAENETGIVGLIGMVKNLSWEHDGYFVRINALVVRDSARKQRVGENLIGVAERWARELGAHVLVLNSGNRPERAAAHQFYPRMGFTSASTGYKKVIGQ